MKKTAISILLFIFFFSYSQSKSVDQKVDSLISLMTIKEKAGQMLHIGLPAILEGDYWGIRESTIYDSAKFKKLIIDYAVGSIHNTPGYPAQREGWYEIVKKIQDSLMTKTRLGIPVLYGIDNIHGANYVNGSVLFPHQIALAATWNTELSKICGEITSYESRAASLPWNFNPNVDVAMNPLWGRISESFGEDPYLISQMGVAYIKGSQGKGLKEVTSTAICLKHFVGYGAGRNGKGFVNELTRSLLGDMYSYKGNIITLTQPFNKAGACQEVANMNKKRLTIFNEPNEDDYLQAGNIKSLTGDDVINARGLYSTDTKCHLMSTIIFECNKKPKVNGRIDDSIINRFINIKFGNNIVL